MSHFVSTIDSRGQIDRKNIFNPDSDPADYRFVKGMEWEYEQEWRLVRNICPPYHVIATVPFPIFLFPFPRTAVHSVIIGCRGFSRLNSKIREILDEEAAYANVKLFTAHTDHNEFQLNIEEFNPTDDVNDINYLLTSGILIPGDEEGHILEDLEQVVVKSAQGTNPDSVHEELQINEQIDSHADDINRYLEKVETHCVESIKEVISNEENKLSVEMAEQLSAIKSSDDGFALFFKKYAIKKSEEAIAILYKAIELSPSKADGNYNAGLALKEVGLYDCSDLFFKNAIRADPTYTAAHYSLGNYYVHFQRAWLAEACFRTALMSDPVFAQARVNLGALYQKDKRPREAEACFRKAIKDDPVLVQARQNLANILILNDNLDEALFHLLELIRLELKDAMVVALVVKLLKKVNDNPEYKDKVIISLIEIIKDSTFIETIVFGLRLAGLAGCAIPFIEKLLLMSPLAPKPNLDMASIYKKLGNVSGSQEYLNKAQSIVKTDEPKLLIYLAAIKGDLDQAFEHIQNCIVHKQVDADWLIYEPNLVWIREDPRFNIIVRQLQAGI